MLFSEPEIRKTTICDIFGHHHPNNREPTVVQWNCPCMVLLLSIYVYDVYVLAVAESHKITWLTL